MIRNITIGLACSIASGLTTYLSGAFVSLEFNIFIWENFSRLVIVFTMIFSFFAAVTFPRRGEN